MTRSVRTLIYATFVTRTLLVLTLFGCSTHRVALDSKLPNNDKGRSLGYVTGESGGFIWSGCQKRAQKSLDELVANAKALGADGLSEVRWDATGTSDPGCRRIWPFAVLWPFALTPMFMNTRVEAVAIKSP